MAPHYLIKKCVSGVMILSPLWLAPIVAHACVKPEYYAQKCPASLKSTTICQSLARQICVPGQTAATAKRITSPCMVGSCVNPKGKTKDEWMRMSQAARERFILAMPRNDFVEFQNRAENGTRP